MAKTKGKVTPLMQQYFELKSKHPDAILLFRVGDFYETFGEDAVKASGILGIVLTARNNGGANIELAGFPYHSLDVYLPKLVKAGLRVAICEQLEKPSKEKKILKRGITDIITPGLGTSDSMLDHKSNNYLASVCYGNTKNTSSVALLDLSTGEFLCAEGNTEQIDKILYSFDPSEVIYSKTDKSKLEHLSEDFYLYGLDEWIYGYDFCHEKLIGHFKSNSLKGFGIDNLKTGQIAAGSIIYYLQLTENTSLEHINKISRIQNDDYVWLDQFSMRNLELVNSLHPSGVSLLQVLDYTKTPMGARLLRKWILLPLTHLQAIQRRQDMVTSLFCQPQVIEEIDGLLSQIGDMERLVGKVAMSKCNPKELFQLKKSILLLPEINKVLSNTKKSVFEKFDHLELIVGFLNDRIEDDPPFSVNKGKVIKTGYNAELDELRSLIKNSKDILQNVLLKETQSTGIQNLKIGFNNVFGYYFEVTNKYRDHDLIPESWIRKQTLTNAERYISEELKILESKILGAEEKILALETTLYETLLSDLIPHINDVKNTAEKLSELDTLASLAKVALRTKYTAPVINDGYEIKIAQGRHPVIEQHLKLEEDYIPNDLYLDNDTQQIIMITGPNMSGKSAILRQTALICLMAQMGSYVPAETAVIGLVDKIFTRVGASDNISSGESTFMVEM
ncbi:MAG: DNA mismatch repair protein MutS, partial [Saprospiraceae bacterium]